MQTYIVRPGYSFRDSDGSLKTGGQPIDLSPDVAAAHADKVDPYQGDATSQAITLVDPMPQLSPEPE